MNDIKKYLSRYIKKTYNAGEYDINYNRLGVYLESLDIVDLVIEIERYFRITIDDYEGWENMYLNDIVKYINSKINGYGEENTK